MAIAGFCTQSTEGADFTTVYTGYNQANAQSSTNDPATPGPNGPFALGQSAKGTDGSDWTYVLASGAIAIGDVVIINNTAALWTASSVTSTSAASKQGDLIAVAPLVAFADTNYGWVQRSGKCAAISVIGSSTANLIPMRTTTTAGRITNTLATGATVQISGVTLSSAKSSTAGTAPGVLNWPTVSTAD